MQILFLCKKKTHSTRKIKQRKKDTDKQKEYTDTAFVPPCACPSCLQFYFPCIIYRVAHLQTLLQLILHFRLQMLCTSEEHLLTGTHTSIVVAMRVCKALHYPGFVAIHNFMIARQNLGMYRKWIGHVSSCVPDSSSLLWNVPRCSKVTRPWSIVTRRKQCV